MKLINALRIFVAILFLISPIEILGEEVPKNTIQNHAKRKLKENENYIIVKYEYETAFTYAKQFQFTESRKQVDYIICEGQKIDHASFFTIPAKTSVEMDFSKPAATMNRFFSYDSE